MQQTTPRPTPRRYGRPLGAEQNYRNDTRAPPPRRTRYIYPHSPHGGGAALELRVAGDDRADLPPAGVRLRLGEPPGPEHRGVPLQLLRRTILPPPAREPVDHLGGHRQLLRPFPLEPLALPFPGGVDAELA